MWKLKSVFLSGIGTWPDYHGWGRGTQRRPPLMDGEGHFEARPIRAVRKGLGMAREQGGRHVERKVFADAPSVFKHGIHIGFDGVQRVPPDGDQYRQVAISPVVILGIDEALGVVVLV